MIGVLMLTGLAVAQDYAFPTSAADYGEFYPTAYKDHGGVTDWDCGSISYAGHQGSDFGAGSFAGMDAGRDITAAADGEVIAAHDGEFDRCTTGTCYGGGGFGNYVYVAHADGKVTIYGHLKEFSVLVGVGDQVTCGQKLGEMGSSGYSTGPHLHFQVNNTAGASEDPFDGPCSAPPSYWLNQGVHGGLPDNTCGPPVPCAPAGALTCGQRVSASNDGVGSTNATFRYGCTAFTYNAPELSWTFTSPVDTPVTLSMTGLSQDLDVYVLGSAACDGDDCIAASSNPDASDEVVDFVATAGTEYVVVVDGWEGAISPFDLDVACAIVPGTTGDTGATGTTGTPGDTADTGSNTNPTVSTGPTGTNPDIVPKRVLPPGADNGCGCASSGVTGTLWLLGALLVALPRRAHRRLARIDS